MHTSGSNSTLNFLRKQRILLPTDIFLANSLDPEQDRQIKLFHNVIMILLGCFEKSKQMTTKA